MSIVDIYFCVFLTIVIFSLYCGVRRWGGGLDLIGVGITYLPSYLVVQLPRHMLFLKYYILN